MDKIFDYFIPGLIVLLVAGGAGAYYHFSATTFPTDLIEKQAADEEYLSANQKKYADCYYTTVSKADFTIEKITSELYFEGFDEDLVEKLETEFEAKYEEQCSPVMSEYSSRYQKYSWRKKDIAEAQLSQIDRWLGKEPEIQSNPSSVFAGYNQYSTKSLQYPTYRDAELLYTEDDYINFLAQIYE